MRAGVRLLLFALLGAAYIFISSGEPAADPGRYPEYARQEPPKDIQIDFISLDQLVAEIVDGKKPLIIDVRSREEYEEAHIMAALSIPLGEVASRLAEIPQGKPVVLY